jgi:peroxiredoxin
MALTPSNMLPLGTLAPDFRLPDTISGQIVTLDQIAVGPALVLMFICNHCPYVKHVQAELVRLARDYQPRGVVFAAISSNDVEHYPEDSPQCMKAEAQRAEYPFPYLFDETQMVARAYKAACTPDFYVFDQARRCVYRGRLDGATPGNDLPVDGADLRAALDALLEGREVSPDQKPSLGCNIKWKSAS